MQRIPPTWFPRAIAIGLLSATVGALTWTPIWAAGLAVAILAVFAKVILLTFEDFGAPRATAPTAVEVERDDEPEQRTRHAAAA
jgi:integral membrane sensor domain MASE1